MGIGLVKAREMAGDLHAEVKLGQDPAAQKAEAKDQAADTFDVTADRFLKVKEGKISANYHGEMTRHLKEDAKPLHGLPVRMVKRRIVASLLSDLRESRSESTADHVRSSLSTFFTWVLKEGLMGDDAANPVTYTHKEKARTCADDGRVARDMESDCRRRRL